MTWIYRQNSVIVWRPFLYIHLTFRFTSHEARIFRTCTDVHCLRSYRFFPIESVTRSLTKRQICTTKQPDSRSSLISSRNKRQKYKSQDPYCVFTYIWLTFVATVGIDPMEKKRYKICVCKNLLPPNKLPMVWLRHAKQLTCPETVLKPGSIQSQDLTTNNDLICSMRKNHVRSPFLGTMGFSFWGGMISLASTKDVVYWSFSHLSGGFNTVKKNSLRRVHLIDLFWLNM